MLRLAVAFVIVLSLAFSLVTQRCEAQASKDPINLTVQGTHGANLLRFTPDGRHMVTAAYGAQLYLWQVETGRLLRTIQALAPGETIQEFQVLPDGETAVVATRDVLRIVNLRTGKQKSWFSVGDRFASTDWMLSPDGKRLLTQGDVSSHPRAWNLDSGRLLFTLHRPDEPPEFKIRYAYIGGLYSTALSPDGRWIISSAFGKPIALFNGETGQFVRDMKGTAGKWAVRGLQFTQDGRHFLVTTEIGNVQTLQVWNFGKQELVPSARNPFTTYAKHRLLNDATSILTVAKRNDREVLVYRDLVTGKTLREFEAVTTFAVNRAEDVAAVAGRDTVYAVRLSDGRPIAPVSAHGQSVWLPAQLSPSRILLSREEKSGLAQVLDIVGGFVTVTHGNCGPGPYVDHRTFASTDCNDGTARFLTLVDAADGSEVFKLPYPFSDGLSFARLRYADHCAFMYGGDTELKNQVVLSWDTLHPGFPTRRALTMTDKSNEYIGWNGDFSAYGQLFASAEGISGLFSVWSTATGGKLFTLVDPASGKSDKGTARTHSVSTEGVRFTSNPAILLTFGDDTPRGLSHRDDLVMRSLQKQRHPVKTWDVASHRLNGTGSLMALPSTRLF